MLPLSMLLPTGSLQVHCAKPGQANGAIIGLTSDGTYNVRLPADGPPQGHNPERWTRVEESNPPAGQRALDGSFTGVYMQVLRVCVCTTCALCYL